MLKILKLVPILIVAMVLSTPSMAHARNQKVRDIYKAQCSAVGGEVNGFCMCSEKLGALAVAAEVVNIAVTTKKLDKESFGIINPFIQSCGDHEVDLKKSSERLEQMLTISQEYAKNEVLLEEMRALDEAGLLDPATFSQYLSNTKFRDTVKAKLTDMKAKQDLLIKAGAGKTLLAIGKDKSKAHAIAMLQELTSIDIAQAKMLSQSVRDAVIHSVEKSSEKTIKATVLALGESAVKKGAKALGRGFIAAVISTAAFEGLSYITGVDLTGFDPFEIAFGVTAVADGTISGAITREPSLLYYPEYKGSFDLGLYSGYADSFTGKVALMSMIAEARSNNDSYVHFLDY